MKNNKQPNDTRKSISISQDQSVAFAIKQVYFPIRKNDWNNLKSMIERVSFPKFSWYNFSSCFVGISVSAFVGACTLFSDDYKANVTKSVLLTIGISTIVIAIICFVAGKDKNKMIENSKQEILNTISSIEENFVDIQ